MQDVCKIVVFNSKWNQEGNVEYTLQMEIIYFPGYTNGVYRYRLQFMTNE